MRTSFFTLVLLFLSVNVMAQENVTYQKPPKEILELVDFKMPPSVLFSEKQRKVVFLYRNTYKTLAEISSPEMRLAGLRINPKTNISSTTTYIIDLATKSLDAEKINKVAGLPANAQLSNFTMSPDEQYMAFTNTVSKGLELWVLDIDKNMAKKLPAKLLNANLGNPISWFRDSKNLLVRTIPAGRKELINSQDTLPKGPIVSVSDGTKAQNRTYQDLLKDKIDEQNFETLATSELHKISLDGKSSVWKTKSMHSGVSFSPDGKYVLVDEVQRPFSYIVPYSRFPEITTVYDAAGKKVKLINSKPLIETLPQGFMAVQQGKRNISWRADKPSTLYWVEALDKGDPAEKVEYRDELIVSDFPFTKEEKIARTKNRFSGVTWGDDKNAVVYDSWFNNRNSKIYHIDPSSREMQSKILFDRNYQDAYSNPGRFDTKKNAYNYNVLNLDAGNNALLLGEGFTEKGQFPFIDEYNLSTGKSRRLYQSAYTDKAENLSRIIDREKGEVFVSIQSPVEYPNYFIRNIKNNTLKQVTAFENPFKNMSKVKKELITYKRDDGLELTGTLYLPADYDGKSKLPLIIWAYPQEFKNKSTASQNTTNPNDFIFPYYGSPIYWVTRGYAILDDAAFPIVGEGNKEPNDNFIEQLVANGKAAIDVLDKRGIIDRKRVAVGGHSYGAFMTANLLTYSDLFAAGIARSGAYNRTLTPFGFQSEERHYWDAPDVYNAMSPFQNAHKMKTPLLLIHGNDDNNSGTFTMQSERYFNALKGLGAPARLVLLPKESHGYAARESILHVLWEQDQWLEKYLKPAKKPVAK
ncbi:alpha/beta hydrolase family protein [Haoranjiania flava]|uniref:Prolyl oligopeptidase family serine peptidase n=1 Tax=Haoranjiania flava TaxID=1856322 RepID=A0AAE3IKT5_9BACT|nr:prolyl oligopeptidase family serine peptidase [Haoranjiania flava]MCU7693940.1 prolyl oligopeptidase family serine peptidase [Haoranjiania flava]